MKTMTALRANSTLKPKGQVTASRLFFALYPSNDAVQQISECAIRAQQYFGGRIMRPDTLHLTLAFLGHTDMQQAEQLVANAPDWHVETGSITLSRIGSFLGPRVVWLGPEPDQPEWLYRVYDSLWNKLQSLGWNRPERPFRPHVSLLRNANVNSGSAMSCTPVTWSSGEAVLIASTPQPGGSHYQVLARVPAAS